MDAKELKTLLDRTGSRIVGKFIRDQQSLVDTFKAEVSRSLDALYPVLLKELKVKDSDDSKTARQSEDELNAEALAG